MLRLRYAAGVARNTARARAEALSARLSQRSGRPKLELAPESEPPGGGSPMNIGKEQRTIFIEPIEEPEPQEVPAPEPQPQPVPEEEPVP